MDHRQDRLASSSGIPPLSSIQDALDEENKPGFTVGEEIKFGDYNGGFSKVSMGMAITKTCKNPAEAATLIELPVERRGRCHHGF